MTRTAVLNVVGLTPRLIGELTPRIRTFCERSKSVPITPSLPAVTCTAQSNYLTGTPPSSHGIVANGWYDRSLAEVQFWKQSNHLVHGEKLWETLRHQHPGFTCAKLFWWYNMYSSADWSITPRPMYPADGRKFFDVYAWPYSLRTQVKADLGEFPFPGFWGPVAGRQSPQGAPDCATRWIADSARWVERHHQPSLSLVYLPHLDYNLQRFGPLDSRIQRDLAEIDAIVGELLAFYQERDVQPVILSEYGITRVTTPIHLNRIFRERGWLVVKEELGLELLDAGASRVFAVADHQIAHVYVNDPSLLAEVGEVLTSVPGVSSVLGLADKKAAGLDHPRAGDWVAVSREDAWFTYYYWLDDTRAPDFARCVDIHRKPGYDPVELFTDPSLSPMALKAKIAWRLLRKKLGFRMLMDLIPLDAGLVGGSHGCRPACRQDWPMLVAPRSADIPDSVDATGVRDALLKICGGT
jgi:predicted AlkP superfamily pyrophosphatase or phosphodiesterase